MSLFAIADTHLSFGTNKPMDSFPGWQDYTSRLKNNWNRLVTNDDTVVIAGDISWAMNFEELKADFDFINKLNGNKIIIKGNHDYWWNTMTKMKTFVEENGFNSITFVHNNCADFNDFSVCGSRGWFFESEEEQDEKVLKREIMRIKASIECASNKNKILFLHYPPITTASRCEEIIELLKEEGISRCYYGHLHGAAAHFAVDEEIEGIKFKLISADRLNFTPYFIEKF